jgi:ABC-type lipoprotein export system ATPase subunit
VAIARALVIEPRVLIADEMTAELDGSAAEEVLTVVRHLATDGVLVILATHEHAVAGRCDRVLHLVDGGLQAEGPS